MKQQSLSGYYSPWRLIKSYWQSEQRFFAYSMLFAVLLLTISMVALDVLLNYWYNYFYDALQDYNKRDAIDLLSVFLFLAAMLIVIAVYRYYLQAYLGLRWRKWLTSQFVNRWLENRSYYYLESFEGETDNPDQRIQEDIGALVTNTLSLLIGFIGAITTFVAFIYILWKLSGIIHIPLGPLGVLSVPGYLAWVGIIYAILGTYFTFKIGAPLVSLNFEQQRREADFRFAEVDLREHAEDVALYRGEPHEKSLLDRLFDRVLSNWYAIILRQKLVLWFTAGYNQISVILPLMVALPNYFSKVFKLGGLMQTLRAFANVQEALSFFVNSYTQIAEWRAIIRRLTTFVNHMHEVEENAVQKNHFIFHESLQNDIQTKEVNILTPRGEKLLENVNENFVAGQHYLIKGLSGIGKSTFVRMIAGIWPFGSGDIVLPSRQKIMYLPQKAYMPIGTLEDALLFPDKKGSHSRKEVEELLTICGLPELISRLDEVGMWSQQLSPGEQQRIAFVRVLLNWPNWVFMDESTSALDLESEQFLYQLIKTRLPHCSIVSVSHHPSLDAYHDHVVDMKKYSVARKVEPSPA
jgi:putative ATP-binding cassette transporter